MVMESEDGASDWGATESFKVGWSFDEPGGKVAALPAEKRDWERRLLDQGGGLRRMVHSHRGGSPCAG